MFYKKIFVLLFFVVIVFYKGNSETNKETALKKGLEAIKLMDNNKIDESIKLLEESIKLDPDNIHYPYELGYAYYLKKDYSTVNKYLEPLLNHKDINDRVFQLLGNSYDMMGNSDTAIATYQNGLKIFPNSGNLHLEIGVVYMSKNEFDKALSFFENGIKVSPEFPSNYYWASKIFCSTTEEVWGMIYGEIFMNLERNSKRTKEISKLLFDTYRSEIKIKDGSNINISFSQNSVIKVDDNSDKNVKLPFGTGVYEPTLIFSILGIKQIDLKNLNTIRTSFVDNYYKFEHNKVYPISIFEYQKKIKDLGHFEAYNYWLLMKGDEEEFELWYNDNKVKWEAFVTWFLKNGFTINENNKFYRDQF